MNQNIICEQVGSLLITKLGRFKTKDRKQSFCMEFYYVFSIDNLLTDTPLFPLEGFNQKRSRENSEKRLACFLSKNFDDND